MKNGKDWKVEALNNLKVLKIGKLKSWKIGKLKSWKIVKNENMKKLKIGKFKNLNCLNSLDCLILSDTKLPRDIYDSLIF